MDGWMDGWMEGGKPQEGKGRGKEESGRTGGREEAGNQSQDPMRIASLRRWHRPTTVISLFPARFRFGRSRLQRAKTSFAPLRPPSICTAQLKCTAENSVEAFAAGSACIPGPTRTRRGGPLSCLTVQDRSEAALTDPNFKKTAPRGTKPKRKRGMDTSAARALPQGHLQSRKGTADGYFGLFSFSPVNQW